MKLICKATGVQVETTSDEAAEMLIASGGFAAAAEEAPAPRKANTKKKAPAKTGR